MFYLLNDMKMYKILIFIVLSIAAFSCNDRSAVEALQQQTESIHDEAMRDLAVMNRTKRELKNKQTALKWALLCATVW